MAGLESSIFREYYRDRPFVDRFASDASDAVDVVIPVVHTNELWRSNLLSIYREIPVNRLLIGDGGCIGDSIEIAHGFPRVMIFDHREFISLGYSIRKLIEAVETEWFVYLHSDVYLPPGWFENMKVHQERYDWIECYPHLTALVDHPIRHEDVDRSFSGAQMGRKTAFDNVLSVIDDDYLYRNEDIILAELIKRSGFKYSRVYDVFHYHQEMRKLSPWRQVRSFSFQWEMSPEEEIRTHIMQVKGLIKYLEPRPDIPFEIYGYLSSLRRLHELGELDKAKFNRWVLETNPAWLPFHRKLVLKKRIRDFLKAGYAFLQATYHLLFGW